MVLNHYRVSYKTKITKLKKQAFVWARTKKEAREIVYVREAFPIAIKVEAWDMKTVPNGWVTPYIEKIEWVKDGVSHG